MLSARYKSKLRSKGLPFLRIERDTQLPNTGPSTRGDVHESTVSLQTWQMDRNRIDTIVNRQFDQLAFSFLLSQ